MMVNDGGVLATHSAARRALLGMALCLVGCTNTVQVPVAQFGAALSATQEAETGYVTALHNQVSTAFGFRALASSVFVDVQDAPQLSPEVLADISTLTSALQAYAKAMLDLANVSDAQLDASLDKIVGSFEDAHLAALVSATALQPKQIAATEDALHSMAKYILNAIVTRDVQLAAAKAQAPIETITGTIKIMNDLLQQEVKEPAIFAVKEAQNYWQQHPRMSLTERQIVRQAYASATQMITPRQVNDSLDGIVSANRAIAARGPISAQELIENALQIANNASAVYNAFHSPSTTTAQ